MTTFDLLDPGHQSPMSQVGERLPDGCWRQVGRYVCGEPVASLGLCGDHLAELAG